MTIKIAQIGIGYWGPNVTKNLLDHNDVKLSVLCDISQERLIQMAKKNRIYGSIDLITNYKEVNTHEIDAVIITTPANTHYEITKFFLERNKHVFVEKPLTMNTKEAEELCELADKNKVKLFVGHTFLYNSAIRKLKEIVSNKETFGDILYLYSSRLNLGIIRSDMNAMWSLAPHDIAICNYLFDSSPIRVSAYGKSFVYNDIEDVVFMNLEYPENRLAHVHVSWLDPSKTRKLVVVGEKKMAIVDDTSNERKIEVYDKGVDYIPKDDSINAYSIKLRAGDICAPKLNEKEPLKEEINHFIDCIINDKTPLTDGWNGLEVVRILDEAQKDLDI